MNIRQHPLEPARLLLEHLNLLTGSPLPGPVLDMACGDGHNGIFLAQHGLSVTCCDRSQEALHRAGSLASSLDVSVSLWLVDLEQEGVNPLSEDLYGGFLVFRYLHRPIIPCIKKSIRRGGILIYESFTIDQPRFGKPHNPDFLLKPGELKALFEDWEVIHTFEGIESDPPRAIAQLVARKP